MEAGAETMLPWWGVGGWRLEFIPIQIDFEFD
jgi:hypothetical protein